LALSDPILTPLLATREPSSSREDALETILIEHVQPIIARVLARYRPPAMPSEDAEDLAATINLRVVRRLQQLDNGEDPIERLEDYVAAVSYNVIYGFLRRRYPERTRLKNRLRYLIAHDQRFAMWEAAGESICGLARWRGREPVHSRFTIDHATNAMLDRSAPGCSLIAVFERAKGPLRFDDVVRIAADLWHVSDNVEHASADDQPSDDRSPAVEIETRQYVEALWREVQQLRDHQRTALLLNLRDVKGTNGIALLLISGVATLDEIARAMGMTPERLSEVWNELPFDDRTIAGMLKLSRQQVINLRKAARERLGRRMATINRRKP
jgi:DNA-directed RNA polymerase specialized sigma24 family protein